MSHYFTAPLSIVPHGDFAFGSGLPRYKVTKGFAFSMADGYTIDVPAGYVTDLASIPWPARNVWNPADGHWAQAAVVHDFMCSKHETYSRHFCDYVYLAGMLTLGANPRVAWLQYAFLKFRAVYLKIKFGRGYYLPTPRK